MQVTVDSQSISYVADSGDWQISVNSGEPSFVIMPILTGGLVYSSGTNLDNLAALIVAAKADAISRGIAWGPTNG